MFNEFLVYYLQVRPIVQGLEATYAKQFPRVVDWDEEGLAVLYHCFVEYPHLIRSPLAIMVHFRLAFIQHLSSLC